MKNWSKASSVLKDFVERPVKRLLLVEDDETLRRSINELIGGDDIEIKSVGTGEEALETLKCGNVRLRDRRSDASGYGMVGIDRKDQAEIAAFRNFRSSFTPARI